MTNLELRDKFKYKSFRLASDNSIIKFELNQVLSEGTKLCDYQVSYDNGVYKMSFDPSHFGPFLKLK